MVGLQSLIPGEPIYSNYTSSPNRIAAAIGSGFPVIINSKADLGSTHWVVAYGAQFDTSGDLTFKIFDPGHGITDGSTTAFDFNSYSLPTSVQAFIISNKPTLSPTGAITVNSPVSVQVTDPLGHTIQFDAVHGLTNTGISGTSLDIEYPLVSPDDTTSYAGLANTQDLPCTAYLSQLSSGEYTFQITGTGNGHFSLSFDQTGSDGSNQNVLSESGEISVGQTMTFTAMVTVPEPPAVILLSLGLATLSVLRYARRKLPLNIASV